MMIRILLCLVMATAACIGGVAPAGLVLSEGAEVTRDPNPAVAAVAGEVLFEGDRIIARQEVRLLSCASRVIATLPAGATAIVTREGIQSEAFSRKHPVNACFLPSVNKSAVGGPKRLGAMMIRSMSGPDNQSRAERLNALPDGERIALLSALEQINGDAPESHVMRGAVYLRHSLHHEAKGEFEAALRLWPGAGWLKPLIVAAEDAAQRVR